MRLLAALCVAVVGTVVVADECCVPLNIIYATITSDGTRSTSKLVANKTTRADVEEIIAESIADSWEARRLATDKTCVANREAIFGVGAPAPRVMPGTPHWMVRGGESFVETDMARFLYDLSLMENPWRTDIIPEAYEKFVLLSAPKLSLSDSFWAPSTAVTHTDMCNSEVTFTFADMSSALLKMGVKVVILAEEGSWTPTDAITKSAVPTGDLLADFKTGIKLFKNGKVLVECTDCLTTTTTTSTKTTTTTTTQTTTSTTTTPEPTVVTQAPTTSAANGAFVSVWSVAMLTAGWFLLAA